MREKIRNQLYITSEDVDFTKISDIEFYVRQTGFFRCYTPKVVSASEMVVDIPYADAKSLRKGDAELQFAFKGENGVPDASDVVSIPVGRLLKEAGYDPV